MGSSGSKNNMLCDSDGESSADEQHNNEFLCFIKEVSFVPLYMLNGVKNCINVGKWADKFHRSKNAETRQAIAEAAIKEAEAVYHSQGGALSPRTDEPQTPVVRKRGRRSLAVAPKETSDEVSDETEAGAKSGPQLPAEIKRGRPSITANRPVDSSVSSQPTTPETKKRKPDEPTTPNRRAPDRAGASSAHKTSNKRKTAAPKSKSKKEEKENASATKGKKPAVKGKQQEQSTKATAASAKGKQVMKATKATPAKNKSKAKKKPAKAGKEKTSTKNKSKEKNTSKAPMKAVMKSAKNGGSKANSNFVYAVKEAREKLGIKGFQVVGGKTAKGQALLKKARSIHKRR